MESGNTGNAGNAGNAGTWDNNYGRRPLRFYVPDEICFVATGPQNETPEARHERLRAEHNAFLAQLTQATQDTQDSDAFIARLNISDALKKDLTPAPETLDFLRAKARANEPVLRDLETRETREARETQRPRWTRLPDVRDEDAAKTSTVFHRFAVGNEADQARPTTERARRVRDLVLLSNLHFRRSGVPVRAVPNWFATASEQHCPSPGSAPVWAPPSTRAQADAGYWSFAFSGERAAAAVRHGRETPSSVIVAVLDTSPTAKAVADAASDPRHAHNTLLRHVAAAPNVTIDRHLPAPPHPVAHLSDMRANWRDRGESAGAPLPEIAFRMDDHGLFVTGIIHDIAPNAEINLIRVLNGFGVTDHHAMIHALAHLPHLLDNDKQRLIVNLSLGFAIPPGVEVLRLWMRETYMALEAQFGATLTLENALAALAGDDRATLQAILDDLHAGLKDLIDWLTAHPQILMVAAAGNDNRFFGRRAMRPEPRWPARYDGVLGVAAVGRTGAPAEYSNDGDATVIGNGIATFGGDATRVNDGDLGKIDTGVTPVDAIAGIYASEQLTLGTGANETSWVYWSGTSFATPIITALAADLWDMRLAERRQNAALPAYGPQELIAEIVTQLFTTPRDTTDPDTLSTPMIAATQEWATAWRGFP